MNTVEVLEAARELIADPEHWTQGVYAKSALGLPIGPSAPGAVCWCAEGAMRKVTGDGPDGPWWDAFLAVSKLTPQGLIRWNDDRTHAEVLAKFDEAIAAAKASHE